MIETILSIKSCIALVFFIGLITGFFYVRRLIKEDYLPIIKKYKNIIKEHNADIKKYEESIQKYNNEISQIRDEIKDYKNQALILEEDLLNVEHNYSKQSDIVQEKKIKLKENEKVLNSIKQEAEYLETSLNNKESIISKNDELKKDIISLQEDINKQKKLLDEYTSKIDILKVKLQKQKESINIKKLEKTRLEHELKKLENSIKDNPKLAKALEIDKLKRQLQEYKTKIMEIKDAK